MKPDRGTVVAEIDGQRIDLVGRTPEEIVDLGIVLVPEGRRLFPRLSVEENLVLGAYWSAACLGLKRTWRSATTCFPSCASGAGSRSVT